MIKAYASSSKGNVFEVTDGDTRLLLECGMPYKRLQELVDYRSAAFTGCLITHEHMDHARAAKTLHQRGTTIYSSEGTLDALNISGPGAVALQCGKTTQIGSLLVCPFPVHHDAAEPFGYLIASSHSNEKCVFATDTYRIGYTFPGLTEIAIECNYCDELLEASNLSQSVVERIKRNHFSLAGCEAFLQANDLTAVKKIHLIHLSSERSDAAMFRREIMKLTGKEVDIA